MAIQPRLGAFHRLGFDSVSVLIPPDPEVTTMIDAGPLRFGVELRTLPEDLTQEAAFQGPSVHVYGADDGNEYLRFDIFDGLPHYHYIDPFADLPDGKDGVVQTIVPFDFAASGPMWPWVIECLRSRLGAMLHENEMHELADRVDNDEIAKVLPRIIELVEPTAPTEHWIRPSPQATTN